MLTSLSDVMSCRAESMPTQTQWLFAQRKRFLTSVTKSKLSQVTKKKHAKQPRTYATDCFAREARSCDGSLLSLCIDDRKDKSVWSAEH